MRGWTLCFLINLLICIEGKSQQVFAPKPPCKSNFAYTLNQRNITAALPPKTTGNKNPPGNSPVKTVPSAFYFNSIGFFCQKELQLEKSLKFAVKFRLGSVAYTNEMEGKGKGNVPGVK
jgi:hypothetical protein